MKNKTPDFVIHKNLDELNWHLLNPNVPNGPQIAPLWGDPKSGPYGALLRVLPGYESPMHTHSDDERILVIKGSSHHWTDSESRETAIILNPGDYMVMPADVKHVSSSMPGKEYLELVTQDGKYDFKKV